MNYHAIRTDDMLNGDGLRVIIFLSGCSHHCPGCHNSETWCVNSGKPFTKDALKAVENELQKDYISGLTISGGDPLYKANLPEVYRMVKLLKEKYPNKTIWLYTGYKWEDIQKDELKKRIVSKVDVLVDGKFVKSLADVNYHWAGSTNQRVIDVKPSLNFGKIILYN